METVFEFIYNPDTYECESLTISIHKTRKGAEMALDFHKAERQRQLDILYRNDLEDKPNINSFQHWDIRETKILE